MPSSRPLVGLFAAALLSRAVPGDTINVPGDFPTIQQGINAAADGDEVLVADGVYTGAGNWDIDFDGRLITVRSVSGPDQCIIDCALSAHRGFDFHRGETRAAVVDGFTIRGARLGCYDAGAILCDGSSPTIVNCTIVDNWSSGDCTGKGGGIYLEGGSPAILYCTIIDNRAFGYTGGAGGGIYCDDSNPVLANCTIAGNSASGFYPGAGAGGGVYVYGGSAVVASCTFSGNTGGGLYDSGGADVTATNCIFWGNGGNGMVNGFNTVATVTNCTFSGNSASGMRNSFNNSAIVTNCTFSGNLGGGLVDYAATARVSNCILWGNSSPQVSHQGITTTVTFSDVQGGYPGVGNIDTDPLFVDADGPDDVPGNGDDDLRLQAGSPCIDAGKNWGVGPDLADLDGDGDTAELTPLDLQGLPRFADVGAAAHEGCGVPVIVDQGASEHRGDAARGPIYFADLDADGDVTIADLMILSGCLGSGAKGDCCIADLDLDGDVSTGDSGLLVAELAAVAPDAVGPEPLPSVCQVAHVGPSGAPGVFGRAVAVCGDTALISYGVYYPPDSAHVFRFEGSTWVDTQTLLASDGQPNDHFAHGLAIDGDTALVGAFGHVHDGHGGAAYVFRFDGTSWQQQQELFASDGALNDGFGYSVSARGDVALIGAPGDGDQGYFSGSAYVFRFDPLSQQWFQEQKLLASDGAQSVSFGYAVAIDGDTAVVGAPGNDSAYVFRFDRGNSQWTQDQKLLPVELPPTNFGVSVAVSADVILIGAPFSINSLGSAHVFRFDPLGAPGARWAAEQTLLASDFLFASRFGKSVSVDGDAAIVGAWDTQDGGAAYVFRHRKGLGWGEVQRLLPAPRPPDQYPSYFGWSAALSGDAAVVGAHGDYLGAYMYAGVSGAAPDCNANDRADLCDLVDGTSQDADGNGVPDECDGP